MHSVVACHSVYVPLRQLFERTHARAVVIMHTTQNNYRKRGSSCAPFAFSTANAELWATLFPTRLKIFPLLYRRIPSKFFLNNFPPDETTECGGSTIQPIVKQLNEKPRGYDTIDLFSKGKINSSRQTTNYIHNDSYLLLLS